MNVFATGARHGTRYVRETDFGVVPPSPRLRALRHTSNSLLLGRDSFTSNELRPDGQIVDMRLGNRRVSGEVGIEFSFGEYDDFLAAALRSTWRPSANGREILTAGTEAIFFTIERWFDDLGRSQYATGCRVDTLKLSVATNAMVTGGFGFLGRDLAFAAAPLDPEPAASHTAKPFDGFSGRLSEGGAVNAVVTSLELSLDNGLEPAFVIGSDTAPSLVEGRINLTGTLTAYFDGRDMLDKFAAEKPSSLVFTLGDGLRESYVFTLPLIKYTAGDNPAEGPGPVLITMPFQALYDPASGTNIMIERITGAAAGNP